MKLNKNFQRGGGRILFLGCKLKPQVFIRGGGVLSEDFLQMRFRGLTFRKAFLGVGWGLVSEFYSM